MNARHESIRAAPERHVAQGVGVRAESLRRPPQECEVTRAILATPSAALTPKARARSTTSAERRKHVGASASSSDDRRGQHGTVFSAQPWHSTLSAARHRCRTAGHARCCRTCLPGDEQSSLDWHTRLHEPSTRNVAPDAAATCPADERDGRTRRSTVCAEPACGRPWSRRADPGVRLRGMGDSTGGLVPRSLESEAGVPASSWSAVLEHGFMIDVGQRLVSHRAYAMARAVSSVRATTPVRSVVPQLLPFLHRLTPTVSAAHLG